MPAKTRIVDITALGGQGDGVAETPDGPLHLAGYLPGERAEIDDQGQARHIGPPSAERRAQMLCPHVPRCGGCRLQHMSEALYRQWKADLLTKAFTQHGLDGTIEPMISVGPQTRRRATLTAAYQDGALRVGFHGARSHDIEPLTACAVLVPAIVRALPALRDICLIVTPKAGETRLAILAADNGLDLSVDGETRPLSADGRAALARIASGNRITRLTVRHEPIVQQAPPKLAIEGVDVSPPPASFLQAAQEAERAMSALAIEAMRKSKRIADLFAGLGTFTFGVARQARVLAIDSDRRLIETLEAAARHAQGLKPIETRVRDLFRDPLSPRELDSFDAVIFDPPRAGAKDQAAALAASKIKTIVAVSCNPATLARDLRTLVDGGYRIERAVPIDQFLYSAHLEAVVILRR